MHRSDLLLFCDIIMIIEKKFVDMTTINFFHFEVERNVFMSYATINNFGAVGGGVSKALVIMIVRIGCYGLKS